MANVLDQGWCKYKYSKLGTGFGVTDYCATGAIYYVYKSYIPYIARDDLIQWMDEFSNFLLITEHGEFLSDIKPNISPIVIWNDYCPNLTQIEVVRTFRAFADKERKLDTQRYLIG